MELVRFAGWCQYLLAVSYPFTDRQLLIPVYSSPSRVSSAFLMATYPRFTTT